MNCQRNLPAYARWQEKFAKDGVAIIGVHTPETANERRREKVAERAKEIKLTYPVLLDPEGENWRRWNQRYWPTVYLIDRKGRVRYHWEGELDWQHAGGEAQMATRIAELLREKP